MAHDANVAYNNDYFEIKQELESDDYDQLMPKEALWLIQEAEQEQSIEPQTYKDELYVGHVVKEELVISPEVLQQSDSVGTVTGTYIGTPCPRILQRNIQDTENEKRGDLNKEITDYKTDELGNITNSKNLASECNKAHVAIITTKNPGNHNIKEHEYNNLEINPLPSQEKPYTCTYCNYNTDRNRYLKQHLRKHSGEKPYTCTFCKYSCCTMATIKKHLKTHTDEKPYTCSRCKYNYSRKSDLIQHLKTHTSERSYTCGHCNYSCKFKSYLKRHLRMHIAKKPYTCTFCKYSCRSIVTLKQHLRIHTDEEPYTCLRCKYNFSRKCDLIKHLRTHIGKKP